LQDFYPKDQDSTDHETVSIEIKSF